MCGKKSHYIAETLWHTEEKGERVFLSPCLRFWRCDTVPMRNPGLGDSGFSAAFFASPTASDAQQWVCDIVADRGLKASQSLLGVPRLTLNSWLFGLREPSAGALRAIFLVWWHVRHPNEQLSDFDLRTWGRFHPALASYNHPQTKRGDDEKSACGVKLLFCPACGQVKKDTST